MKDYKRVKVDGELTTSAPWRDYVYKIETINIGEGITTVGYDAFEDMYSIKNVNLPSTLTDIKDLAFHTCTSLQKITLPENLKNIGESAFSASRLISVTFPESLENIGSTAFPSLKTAILQSGETLSFSAFGYNDDVHASYNQSKLEKLYCAADLIQKCNDIALSIGIEAIEYKQLQNGRFSVGNTQFLSLTDIQNGQAFNPKRIYTVEEASRFSKPTGNTFRLRYK